MGIELFDRSAAIAFGQPGALGRRFEGFRIKFRVEKTPAGSPNKAKVSIFNLGRDSRSKAELKNQVLLLSAGYGGVLEDLFTGNISRVVSELQSGGTVTDFECGDGEKAYQVSRTDLSFKAGTSLTDVFQKVIESFGLKVGDLSAIKDEKVLNGITLAGMSRQVLENLTKRQGLQWSIQDGVVQITPTGEATKQTAVLLNPQTGLLGIPKRKNKGIEVVSLLQPKLKPGREIRLESRLITGSFICGNVTHEGDTHGKEWFTTVEATQKGGT